MREIRPRYCSACGDFIWDSDDLKVHKDGRCIPRHLRSWWRRWFGPSGGVDA